MPDEYYHCKIRLQREQQRFLNFGLEAGVLYEDGTICETLRVNRSLLLAVLAEIKTLFEQYATANGKYVDSTSQHEVEWDNKGDPETDLVAILCLPAGKSSNGASSDSSQTKHQRSKGLRQVVRGIVQTGRNIRTIALEPKRLVWATMDKASFEGLIAKLGDFNSFLIALLDSAQIERLQLTMDTSYNEILQIRDDLRSLTGLVKALSNETEKKDELLGGATIDDDHVRRLFLQETKADRKKKSYLKKLTEVKIRYKSIGDQVSTRKPLDLSHFVFDVHENDEGLPGNHASATYQGRHVWIEWKNYPSNPHYTDPVIYGAENRIRLLADLLCNELPESFR